MRKHRCIDAYLKASLVASVRAGWGFLCSASPVIRASPGLKLCSMLHSAALSRPASALDVLSDLRDQLYNASS